MFLEYVSGLFSAMETALPQTEAQCMEGLFTFKAPFVVMYILYIKTEKISSGLKRLENKYIFSCKNTKTLRKNNAIKSEEYRFDIIKQKSF